MGFALTRALAGFSVQSKVNDCKARKRVKSLIDSCLLIKGSVIGYQHKTNPFERILDRGVLAFSSKYFGTSPTTLREGPQFYKNAEPPCSSPIAGGRRPTREGGRRCLEFFSSKEQSTLFRFARQCLENVLIA